MLSLSPTANPLTSVFERSNAAAVAPTAAAPARASTGAMANAMAKASADARAQASQQAQHAATAAKASVIDTSIPDVTNSFSSLAAMNAALGSMPATLQLMNDIAVASGSGTLSDEERSALQSQYADLTQQMATIVQQSGAAAATNGSTARDAQAGQNTQSSDDARSTLTRTDSQPAQLVYATPTEQLVRSSRSVTTPQYSADRNAPRVNLLTHELHVGVDSYEPVAVRQALTRIDRPASFAQVEQEDTSQRVRTQQVMRITQLSEVAQSAQVSVVA